MKGIMAMQCEAHDWSRRCRFKVGHEGEHEFPGMGTVLVDGWWLDHPVEENGEGE